MNRFIRGYSSKTITVPLLLLTSLYNDVTSKTFVLSYNRGIDWHIGGNSALWDWAACLCRQRIEC